MLPEYYKRYLNLIFLLLNPAINIQFKQKYLKITQTAVLRENNNKLLIRTVY